MGSKKFPNHCINYFHIQLFIVFVISFFTPQIKGQWNTKYTLLKACLKSKGIDVQSLLIPRDLNSAAYVDCNFQSNECCGGLITPMSYLTVTETSQVQAAVICCKLFNIRIVPKAGGHSYGKYSFGDSESLVLDFRQMNSVNVDKISRTAVVGPGTLIGPLAYKLYKHGGFGVPIGECMIIGITTALGGGYGQFSRLHGLTGDNLVELEMVDANGQKLIANNSTNSDLFWALRGAGAGNFGIITKYKFKLFDMPKVVVWGEIEYSIYEFPQVFDAYQKYALTNPPRTINVNMIIPLTSAGSKDKVMIYVFENQTEKQAKRIGQRTVKYILKTQFPTPRSGKMKIWSLNPMEFILYDGYLNGLRSDNVTNVDQLEHVTGYSIEKAVVRYRQFVVPRKTGILNMEGIFELFRLLKQRPETISISVVLLGGAINDLKATDTAYVHRQQALYEIRPFFGGPRQQESLGVSWLTNFFERTKYLMQHTETLPNHLDIELPDYLQRYYGQNLQRLITIKRKYDPENIFHNPQSIPTR